MKKLRYLSELTRPDGYPFRIPEPDPEVREQIIRAAVNKGQTVASIPTVRATFASAVIWFLNNIPFIRDGMGNPARKLSAEDVGNCYSIIKAFRAAETNHADMVEVEDTAHNWMMDILIAEGPIAFHNVQPEIVERFNSIISDK